MVGEFLYSSCSWRFVELSKTKFLFLSETIAATSKIEELRAKLGFSQCFSVVRIGRGGGLAVIWKHHV